MFDRDGMDYRYSDLARDLGVSQNTASSWRNGGKISQDNIRKLATHFGATSRRIYELLGESPPDGLNDTLEIVAGRVMRLGAAAQARLLKDLEAGKYDEDHK